MHVGRVGAELSEAQGCEAAEIAALNALAGIRAVLGGDFADLVTLLRVEGHVASAAGFVRQARILDDASKTFRSVLGERGRHARAAFAVSRLPLDAPIQLVVTFGVTAKQASGQ